MKTLNEDGVSVIGTGVTNNVSGGSIAGLGVENPFIKGQAEPAVNKKKKKSFKMFRRETKND